MAESTSKPQKPLLTQEQLRKKLAVSNFDPNAILRGAQLTVVGGQPTLMSCFKCSTDFVKLYARSRTPLFSLRNIINRLL